MASYRKVPSIQALLIDTFSIVYFCRGGKILFNYITSTPVKYVKKSAPINYATGSDIVIVVYSYKEVVAKHVIAF